MHLGVGKKRGAPTPDLAFRSCQPLFLSFRLSSSALKMPNPEKPTFSVIMSSIPWIPVCPLTNGSAAHPSHYLPSCSREMGTPGSSKKKQQKQHRGAVGSSCALAVKGKDEVSNPPTKEKKLIQESFMGKEAAGNGPSSGQEGLGSQNLESPPKPQVSDSSASLDKESIYLCKKKKKKKKRRMEETEEHCPGMLSSDR